MCSGGQIQQTDEALQKSEAASNAVLTKDYSTAFANQQSVLGQQRAKLSYMASNPLGYTPQQLHLATSSINENVANAARQAIGRAAGFAAAHGSADIGGGATGAMAGEIASEAGQSKAAQLSQVAQADQSMKQQNFWKSIEGLNQVGSEYGSSSGTAISGAGTAAGESVNAGSGALAAKESGFSEFGSVLSGIGGLVGGVAGIKGIHV